MAPRQLQRGADMDGSRWLDLTANALAAIPAGKGATFNVTLPLARSRTNATAEPEALAADLLAVRGEDVTALLRDVRQSEAVRLDPMDVARRIAQARS